jgi:hypothetical protein
MLAVLGAVIAGAYIGVCHGDTVLDLVCYVTNC